MEIKFTKMQGCANDYIYIDNRNLIIDNPNKLSEEMSKRHFSVGSDGLVLIENSDVADFKMRMFNLDGSEGNMCGNAIRCIAKYVYDNKLTDELNISIETKSGIKYLDLYLNDKKKVSSVKVDMGNASFDPKDICLNDTAPAIDKPITIDGKEYKITCVSMGNPHAVTLVDNVMDLKLEEIGPKFENDPYFINRVNTEFIELVDDSNLKMRVWERGSGETYACGTGACATVSALVKLNILKFNKTYNVHLLGGILKITVDDDYRVLMEGPAVKVYDGVYEYED